jgi:hypothetical protein
MYKQAVLAAAAMTAVAAAVMAVAVFETLRPGHHQDTRKPFIWAVDCPSSL